MNFSIILYFYPSILNEIYQIMIYFKATLYTMHMISVMAKTVITVITSVLLLFGGTGW